MLCVLCVLGAGRRTVQGGLEEAGVAAEVDEVQQLVRVGAEFGGGRCGHGAVVQHGAAAVVAERALADAARVAALDFVAVAQHAGPRAAAPVVQRRPSAPAMAQHRDERRLAAADATANCMHAQHGEARQARCGGRCADVAPGVEAVHAEGPHTVHAADSSASRCETPPAAADTVYMTTRSTWHRRMAASYAERASR